MNTQLSNVSYQTCNGNQQRISFESIQSEFNKNNKRTLEQLLKPQVKKPKFVSFAQLLNEQRPIKLDSQMISSFSNSFGQNQQNSQIPPFRILQSSYDNNYQDFSQNFTLLNSNSYQLMSASTNVQNNYCDQNSSVKQSQKQQQQNQKQGLKINRNGTNLSVIREEAVEESDQKNIQKFSAFQNTVCQTSTSKQLHNNTQQIQQKNLGQFILPQNEQEVLSIMSNIQIDFLGIKNQWIEFRLHDLVLQILQGLAQQIKKYHNNEFENVNNLVKFLDKEFMPLVKKYFKQDQENIDLSTKMFLEQEKEYIKVRNERIQQVQSLILQNEQNIIVGKSEDSKIYQEIIKKLELIDQNIAERHNYLNKLTTQVRTQPQQQNQQQVLELKLQKELETQKQSYTNSQNFDFLYFDCLKNLLYENAFLAKDDFSEFQQIREYDPYLLIVNQLEDS